MKPAIYGNTIEAYKKYADGKKTIVYCASIKHSQSVAEAFRNAGYKAVHMDGNTPKRERECIMEDFRSGAIQIITNVMLIVEGISVPDCECCILLRPTLSTTIYIQSAMRCMRYKEGKRAVIIDMVMNYLRLGMPDEDREWSLDKPTKHRRDLDENGNFYIRTCEKCFKVFKTAPVCPYCGAIYPLHPREIKAHENVELARITAEEAAEAERKRKQARMEQGKARSFPELLAIGKERGYKNPAAWAAMVMRGRR
jgi:superfamily II DNA or RNA helicase